MPAERELAENFGLNRSTVRAAIQTLVEEGLLKRSGQGNVCDAPCQG
ncbi:MAG: GntR family transcriptional regulator [[Clostridium] symbiosum]